MVKNTGSHIDDQRHGIQAVEIMALVHGVKGTDYTSTGKNKRG